MAFFSRDEPPSEAPPAGAKSPARSEPVATATRVAPGSRFEGKLLGGTDVIVDGELTGTVELSASLTVGAKGKVEASVHALAVRVGGQLKGDVVVDERLEVLPGGRLEGDVRAPRVAISEGGFFRGNIDMGKRGEKPAAAPATERAAAGPPSAQGTTAPAAKAPAEKTG